MPTRRGSPISRPDRGKTRSQGSIIANNDDLSLYLLGEALGARGLGDGISLHIGISITKSTEMLKREIEGIGAADRSLGWDMIRSWNSNSSNG
jgi:hypothetical protein